jgi:hypothetical protein
MQRDLAKTDKSLDELHTRARTMQTAFARQQAINDAIAAKRDPDDASPN